MLVVAMLLSWSIAFAASQSPIFQKGKYYGKQLIAYALNGQEKNLECLSEDIEAYIMNNIETEKQVSDFLEGIESGMRQGCREAGFDEETTEAVVKTFEEAFFEGLMGSL